MEEKMILDVKFKSISSNGRWRI